jgi:ferritin-like metal-binding protein YciE
MKLTSLQELYLDQLQDIYWAEQELVKSLPKMAKKASYPELKAAIEEHLRQTEGHVDRIERCFELIGQEAKAKKCKGLEGILDEAQDYLKKDDADPATRDAALIASAQKVEHYEIACYGTVRTYADLLGHREAARLLEQTLDEEKQTDKSLTQIAERVVNIDAARGAGGQAHMME